MNNLSEMPMNALEQLTDQDDSLSIAIIGLAGRFPGSDNFTQFWDNISKGKESIQDFSDKELLDAGEDPALIKNKNYVKRGAVLANTEMFDANFFGITPREAEFTDPQQRIFLETAWEALENAGYDPGQYQGAIGIYGGSSGSRYFLERIFNNPQAMQLAASLQLNIGNEKDFLCSRVAYHLGLQGPAVTVQTACSTSLVAVHLACQSILNGESDIALAGGVSINMFEKQGYLYSEGGITSPDGRCRAFDAQARGTVVGNGVGMVVLKNLADAQTDGDTIHAIIRGSAINNDGTDKVGFTAPSVNGQAAVIAEALAVAGVEADSISYIEAHGTGTTLGDPIEMEALQQAFGQSTSKKHFCGIGSLKTNIGHLDTAAGVAGLIKTVLSLKNRKIPPSLHFTKGNPHIEFRNSPFYVNDKLADWPTSNKPRRAGVSSFGIGGTNSHAIVEEAPEMTASGVSRATQLLLISAKTPSALKIASKNLGQFLNENPDVNLANVAYTQIVGRQHFEYRNSIVCNNAQEALQKLAASDLDGMPVSPANETAHELVFMFPGQGSQYINMAKSLYQTEVVFRTEIDNCSNYLQDTLGLDLRHVLFPNKDQTSEAAELIHQTHITQPALFVVEYALARQLEEWGITPAAMVGHSVGEYVAACLAGVFSLEDGLDLIAQRGRLIASLPPGAMIAVYASEEIIEPLLSEDLWIAAVNAAAICSISGSPEAIDRLVKQLTEQQIKFQTLHASHAFHSGMLDPILKEFSQHVEKIQLQAPKIPYISNVTGNWITTEQATSPEYWVSHLRQPVRFLDCLKTLKQEQTPLLLEVGPGKALSDLARLQDTQHEHSLTLATLHGAKSQTDAVTSLLDAIGKLWLHGTQIKWKQFYRHEQRRRIPLPTYPFERKRYMAEVSKTEILAQSNTDMAVKYRKRDEIAEWIYAPSWKQSTKKPKCKSKEQLATEIHLVFVDRNNYCSKLLERLREVNSELIIVTPGSAYSMKEDGSFIIDASQAEDYVHILSELVSLKKVPSKITHFWSLTSFNSAISINQDDCFYSLLFLTQAFVKLRVTSPLTINIVSNGVHSVLGDEILFPDKATLLGPCQVLPLEFPNVKCRHIDLAEASPINDKTLDLLAEEINAEVEDTIIAYRGVYRWTKMFEQVDFSYASKSHLRENGHFLVVGGLGGIGFTFAKYLAENSIKPTVTLVGRSDIPEKPDWNNYLSTHIEDDSFSIKIRQIQSLEAKGAKVQYIPADISSKEDVLHLKEKTSLFFGEVHAIFHAAGLAETEGRIDLKSHQTVSSYIAPKFIGTQLLGEVFCVKQLDFFMLCSSASSIAPTAGHLEYCAVNSFLDAYAHERNMTQNSNVIAINWSTWQGVGMATRHSEQLTPEERYQKELYHSNCISTQDAPKIFDLLLSEPQSQALVTPVEFDVMLKGTAELNAVLVKHSSLSVAPQEKRPDLQTSFVEPRNELEYKLAEIWQSLFGFERIGVNDDFFELGGHSLLATQVISEIHNALKINLPLNTLFDAPTIATFSKLVEDEQEQALRVQDEEKSAYAEDVKKSLDAMSADELKAMLAEKKRLKATPQYEVTDHE